MACICTNGRLARVVYSGEGKGIALGRQRSAISQNDAVDRGEQAAGLSRWAARSTHSDGRMWPLNGALPYEDGELEACF